MDINKILKENKSQNNTFDSKLFGRIGLPNLGNTCYMNSCIQALSQIFLFSKFFLSDKYKNYINYNNNLGSNGMIVNKYAELIKVLWYNRRVKLIKLKVDNKMKQGYYYDQENNTEIKQKMQNLFNSIVNNNDQYQGYSQNDCIEFMIYFIDILHEDLKIMKKQNELSNEILNSNSIFDIFNQKWKTFKAYNNSIMTSIFYGMHNSIISCPNCYYNINNFEPFNVVHLPVFVSNEKPKKDEIQKYKIGLFQKEKKNNLPNINSIVICKCIILPFNLNQQKIQINIPIFKNQVHLIQMKIINKIIIDIIKDEDLIPTILTDNKCDIKIILEENNYLVKYFNSPQNIEIYFIQVSNKQLNLNLIKNIKIEELFEKLSNFEKKNKKISSENNFMLDEELSSNQTIIDNDNTESSNSRFNILKEKSLSLLNEKSSGFYLLNGLNICFYNKNEKQFQFPRIFKLHHFSTLIDLYNLIYSYFKFSFNFLSEKKNINLNLNDNKKYFVELEDDLSNIKYINDYNYSYYINNNPTLNDFFPFPFILNFKFIRKNNQQQKYYIPIPCSNDLFYNYIEKLRNYNKSNDYYQYVKFSIYIIWFENYYNKLNLLENTIKRETILIDPYLEIEKKNNEKINLIKNDIQKNNQMSNLYDLIDNYVDYQYYDKQNTFFCKNCNKEVYAFQYIELYYLPNIIIFHLQKKHDYNLYKISIEFPINEYLDLSKYNKGGSQDNKYELISVINFTGNQAIGHYNIYCKHDIDKKWYLFNDSICYIVEDLKKEIKFEDVYAVIYKKVNFNNI